MKKQLARVSLYHVRDLTNQLGTHRLIIADIDGATFTVRHGREGELAPEYEGEDEDEARRVYKARLANYLENSMTPAASFNSSGDWIIPGDLTPGQRKTLDDICARETAFGTFDELLNARGNYRPSLNVGKRELRTLADAYDDAQERLGDNRRAFRRYSIKRN